MSHDDFASEPVRGLPETPPEGEHILWQGRPHGLAELGVAEPALGGGVFRAARGLAVRQRDRPVHFDEGGGGASVPFLVMGAAVIALLLVIGYVQARATVYTITNRRVAMRIGAALTVTLNLPYTRIANIDLRRGRGGTGTITLDLMGDTKLSYLVCWPHVRPWVMRRPQPALRAIPEADRIAAMLAEAAETRVATPRIARVAPAPAMAAE